MSPKFELFIALACVWCLSIFTIGASESQKYNTVQVVIEDVMTKPATIYDGQYIPKSYYLIIGYDNQCMWAIQSKEAYEQYKDRIGDTINADVRVSNAGYGYLSKLEGHSIPGVPDNAVFRSLPLGLVYYKGLDT